MTKIYKINHIFTPITKTIHIFHSFNFHNITDCYDIQVILIMLGIFHLQFLHFTFYQIRLKTYLCKISVLRDTLYNINQHKTIALKYNIFAIILNTRCGIVPSDCVYGLYSVTQTYVLCVVPRAVAHRLLVAPRSFTFGSP